MMNQEVDCVLYKINPETLMSECVNLFCFLFACYIMNPDIFLCL